MEIPFEFFPRLAMGVLVSILLLVVLSSLLIPIVVSLTLRFGERHRGVIWFERLVVVVLILVPTWVMPIAFTARVRGNNLYIPLPWVEEESEVRQPTILFEPEPRPFNPDDPNSVGPVI